MTRRTENTLWLAAIAAMLLLIRFAPLAHGADLSSVDIGVPAPPGLTQSAGYDVAGGGSNVWDTKDQFRYAAQKITGDFTASVKVEGIDAAQGIDAIAGVQARATLDAASANAFIRTYTKPGQQFKLATRKGAGQSTQSIGAGVGALPCWLRLIRAGDVFTGAYSVDGTAWASVGSVTVAMPGEIYVGMAVCSRAPGKLAVAHFAQWKLDNLPAPPPATQPVPIPPQPSAWQPQQPAKPQTTASVGVAAGPLPAWQAKTSYKLGAGTFAFNVGNMLAVDDLEIFGAGSLTNLVFTTSNANEKAIQFKGNRQWVHDLNVVVVYTGGATSGFSIAAFQARGATDVTLSNVTAKARRFMHFATVDRALIENCSGELFADYFVSSDAAPPPPAPLPTIDNVTVRNCKATMAPGDSPPAHATRPLYAKDWLYENNEFHSDKGHTYKICDGSNIWIRGGIADGSVQLGPNEGEPSARGLDGVIVENLHVTKDYFYLMPGTSNIRISGGAFNCTSSGSVFSVRTATGRVTPSGTIDHLTATYPGGKLFSGDFRGGMSVGAGVTFNGAPVN
jgi:regulation of enolase protein 1 (concanavalin A-like superfamily)